MDGESYETYTYKLRSAGPTPMSPGRFVTQTFGIDRNKITTYTATTTVNRSSDMTGLYGGTLISSNWQRLPYLSSVGNQLFSGSTTEQPVWLDQDELT
jgi:hypothetical protein